jgi:SAM-dependent methyltransferase
LGAAGFSFAHQSFSVVDYHLYRASISVREAIIRENLYEWGIGTYTFPISMNHTDHVTLLRGGISEPGGVWAEFGSGSGAFTLALAELLRPGAQIYSVDKNKNVLRRQEIQMNNRFPDIQLQTITADYTRSLDLPPLDGVLMANALHFQRKKDGVLQLIHTYLRPGRRLLLVEYNVDRGNHWVPYPLSYPIWEKLAYRNGFRGTRLLRTIPSSFLHEFYSAVSFKRD